MSKYQLTLGEQKKPLKMFVYGPEGVGKSTFAAQMPEPVFIDVEDGSNQLNIARMPQPTSWAMLMDELNEVYLGNVPCSSIVIDTVDSAQDLAIRDVCSEHGLSGIENLDFGKGFVYVYERWCKMLDLLDAIRAKQGINVVLVGHSRIDHMDRPDLEGSYDCFVPNLNNGRKSNVSGRTRAWCDTVLFFDYKTIVNTESDRKGNVKKAKAKGGSRRIVHTTHSACWEAKNRFGWADEVTLDDAFVNAVCSVATYRNGVVPQQSQQPAMVMQPQHPTSAPAPVPAEVLPLVETPPAAPPTQQQPTQVTVPANDPSWAYPPKLQKLADMMHANGVTDAEIRAAVGQTGYFPAEATAESWPDGFADWLVSEWANVMSTVQQVRTA